jgi:hypothetical protein
MKIVLNPTLQENFEKPAVWRECSGHRKVVEDTVENAIDQIQRAVLQKVGGTEIVHPLNPLGAEYAQLGYLRLVSRAYSSHQSLVISPTDLWYIVLSQISQQVEETPDVFRSVFTHSGNKQRLLIPTDDITKLPYDVVIAILQHHVPVDISIFIPAFSTNIPSAVMAMNAAFCGTVKHYYNYMTFMCGFPAIDLQGSDEDWKLFDTHLRELINILPTTEIKKWLGNIRVIITQIRDSLANPNIEFLSRVFTSTRIGSGGELKIDGWIRDFWLRAPELPKLENFSDNWSIVPYTNLETGKSFTGVYGCFLQRRTEDGFVYGNYDSMVIA